MWKGCVFRGQSHIHLKRQGPSTPQFLGCPVLMPVLFWHRTTEVRMVIHVWEGHAFNGSAMPLHIARNASYDFSAVAEFLVYSMCISSVVCIMSIWLNLYFLLTDIRRLFILAQKRWRSAETCWITWECALLTYRLYVVIFTYADCMK